MHYYNLNYCLDISVVFMIYIIINIQTLKYFHSVCFIIGETPKYCEEVKEQWNEKMSIPLQFIVYR